MLKMTFESGRGPIEVKITDSHFGNGEAYFRRDDMLATVTNGRFAHPMWGTEYHVMVPYGGGRREAVLEVRTWREVGRASVFDATPGS